ncbi:histidine phosphatase family protein [Sphingopyxis sp. H115]|nr:histidine phosphatase family protein [Sphingopyxis sp. H115]
MTEIYLIRHGETEWNAAGRFFGKTRLSVDQHRDRAGKALR